MAQLGVDYANTDKITSPDVKGFLEARRVGTRIVIPRAVYGRPAYGQSPVFLDSYWPRDADDIVQAGLVRSTYLFVCVPKTGVWTPSPEQQVEAFIKAIDCKLSGPVEGKKQLDMVPFFDVEEHSDMLSADAYFDWILAVARGLREHFGAWPGMYTSNRVWQEELNGHAAGQLINCPLWLAKPWPWDVRQPAQIGPIVNGLFPTTIPQFGDRTNWLLYQYAGDALGMPGFSPGAVDTNKCQFVKKGMRGDIVRWIQKRAGGLKVDGDFGPATEARVQEIQALYALDHDGIVGCDTSTVLAWLNPEPL